MKINVYNDVFVNIKSHAQMIIGELISFSAALPNIEQSMCHHNRTICHVITMNLESFGKQLRNQDMVPFLFHSLLKFISNILLPYYYYENTIPRQLYQYRIQVFATGARS